MECIKATKSTDCISKSDTTLNKSAFTGAVFPLWSQFTNFVHECIKTFVVSLAVHAARNPKKYVIGIAVISFSLISAGFLTNFSINTDEQVIYAPFKSKPKSHAEWIDNESGFPGNARIFTMALHSDGKNILGAEQIRKALEAVDEVRDTPGYDELCSQGEYVDFDGIRTCKIEGVTRFFKHNSSQFEEIYQSGGEDAIITRISAEAYENDVPVDGSMVFGKAKRNGTTNMVNSTLTFNLYFFLPNVDETINLEASILERMQTLQEAWDNDDNMLKLEFFAIRSYSDEFARAIEEDFYLLPIVFMLMVGFTCLVFVRGDKVQSRSILGVASVITIIFSLMTSFGIMFLIGIPFTSMTQILPFVVIGVGLGKFD